MPVHLPLKMSICDGGSTLLDGNHRHDRCTLHYFIDLHLVVDSIITTNLSVTGCLQYHTYPSICDGDAIHLDGSTTTSSGIFSFTFVSALRKCDSIVTVDLTNTISSHPSEDVSICVGILHFARWHCCNDRRYLYVNHSSIAGCDSIITTNL